MSWPRGSGRGERRGRPPLPARSRPTARSARYLGEAQAPGGDHAKKANKPGKDYERHVSGYQRSPATKMAPSLYRLGARHCPVNLAKRQGMAAKRLSWTLSISFESQIIGRTGRRESLASAAARLTLPWIPAPGLPAAASPCRRTGTRSPPPGGGSPQPPGTRHGRPPGR